MINQNNNYKIMWDLFIMIVLIFISLAVPYRLAFVEIEPTGWVIAYWVIDALFLVDIILTFLTTISEKDSNVVITNRCKIAKSYLKGWFIIDIISILPFDLIIRAINTSGSSEISNYNVLARFARIGKLYKLIRMTRLAKLMKMFQKRAVLV